MAGVSTSAISRGPVKMLVQDAIGGCQLHLEPTAQSTPAVLDGLGAPPNVAPEATTSAQASPIG